MKLERTTEIAMLIAAVIPNIDKVERLLLENNMEEAEKVAMRDVIAILDCYRTSEEKKYSDTPENLKPAPQKQRMLDDTERLTEAIATVYDEKTDSFYPGEKWDLEKMRRLVDEIINA